MEYIEGTEAIIEHNRQQNDKESFANGEFVIECDNNEFGHAWQTFVVRSNCISIIRETALNQRLVILGSVAFY